MLKYIISFFFILVNLLYSFNPSIVLNINNNVSKNTFQLTVGVDNLATNGHDVNLGENSFPTAFPPNTFMAYLETIDSSQTNSDGTKYYDLLWLDKDLKPVDSVNKKFHIRYEAVFSWGTGSEIIVKWNNSLPQGIDSAIIVDQLEGLVFRYDMTKTNKFTITNSGIRKFFIDVYYNNYELSSIYELSNENKLIYPNPACDLISINHIIDSQRIHIYDNSGIEISNNLYKLNGNSLDISKLISGKYFLVVKDNNTIQQYSFIKYK